MKRHVICLGDSNTHGYCGAQEGETLCGGRFSEAERWPCLLQRALGEEYLVIEEGLCGRTTVFPDPLEPGLDAISYLRPCLLSHAPVSLLILMLGTNDTKERFGLSAEEIARGMERLARQAMSEDCWGFLDGEGCELNRVDHMHLTQAGHAQLAARVGAVLSDPATGALGQ